MTLLTAAVYSFPVPPIKRLRAAGVNVACGHDGIRDLWGPYGSGDMLERAMHVAYRSTFRRDEDIELALDAATYGGARALGLRALRLAPGAPRRPGGRRRAHGGRGRRHAPSASSCSRAARSSPATGGSSEPPQRATSSTTFPRLPAARLRSKASRLPRARTRNRWPEAASRRRAAPRSAQAASGWAPPRSTRW